MPFSTKYVEGIHDICFVIIFPVVAPAPINRNRPYANIIKKQEQDHPERSTTPPPGSEFSEVEDMPPVQAPSKSSLEQGPGGFSIPVGMG